MSFALVNTLTPSDFSPPSAHQLSAHSQPFDLIDLHSVTPSAKVTGSRLSVIDDCCFALDTTGFYGFHCKQRCGSILARSDRRRLKKILDTVKSTRKVKITAMIFCPNTGCTPSIMTVKPSGGRLGQSLNQLLLNGHSKNNSKQFRCGCRVMCHFDTSEESSCSNCLQTLSQNFHFHLVSRNIQTQACLNKSH